MGLFLLALLICSGVSVFSLELPEVLDSGVSTTQSLVSRLNQVKVMKLTKMIVIPRLRGGTGRADTSTSFSMMDLPHLLLLPQLSHNP